jgi:hypothetical protein
VLFVAAMIAAMAAHDMWRRHKQLAANAALAADG